MVETTTIDKTKLISTLRQETGAKLLVCRKALENSEWNIDRAKDWLKTNGEASAGTKIHKPTAQGALHAYVHTDSKIAVMVELQCETDFVARNDEFQTLLHNICLHVAASDPQWVNRSDIPADVIEAQEKIFKDQTQIISKAKPKEITDEIVTGKMEKWYGQVCLTDQLFVKDDVMTVGSLVRQAISKFGENIRIARFVRWSMGQN